MRCSTAGGTERAKMCFGVPIGAWLAGPLRPWAEELLGEAALARGGLLDPRPVRRMWAQRRAGHGDWHYALWNVLMFQAWHRRYHASG